MKFRLIKTVTSIDDRGLISKCDYKYKEKNRNAEGFP